MAGKAEGYGGCPGGGTRATSKNSYSLTVLAQPPWHVVFAGRLLQLPLGHGRRYHIQIAPKFPFAIFSGIILPVMKTRSTFIFPTVSRCLLEVGENIRLARLRRNLTAELVAERAGVSRKTLYAIEHGSPGASFGAYASVLHCLGLEKDLPSLGRDDELGRKLQDAGLRTRARAPKRSGK